MDVLRILMREIFDFELTTPQIQRYIDSKTNSLKLGAVLRDPKLISNLAFRNAFKSTVGIYPSRQHANEFMEKARIDGDLDMKEYIIFLMDTIPLYKFINIDINALKDAKDKYIEELRDTSKVKEALATKFCYRFGIEKDYINPQEQLLNVFKNCMFHPEGYSRIKQINKGLARQTNKVPLDIPDVIDTINSYFKVSNDLIEYYELNNLNVFSGYWNPFTTPIEIPNLYTIFDTINYIVLMDSAFSRTILGTICIFWESGDMQKDNKLDILMKSCNNRDNKNVVLFKSIDLIESYTDKDIETDAHILHYNVYVPYLINFIPKLALNYILISEYLYPKTSVITTKTENSIYCCLYDGKYELENKLLLENLIPFDRYLTYDYNYEVVKEKIDQKHVYMIVKDNQDNSIIFNSEFTEHQWNAHISVICPYAAINTSGYHPRFNILLYDQFLLNYYKKNEQKLKELNVTKNAKNIVIMVDNRPNIFSVISLYLTMSNLKSKDWSCAVVCNNENIDFFKKYLGKNVEYITKFNYPSKKFSIDIYNDLLKNPIFWNTFSKYERALFVQDDGMILKTGLEDKFMEYDYVGAPWEKEWANQDPNKFIKDSINPELVGNGGVSLRNIKAMKTICEKYKYLSKQLHYDRIQQQPEDVFFSYCCVQEKLKLPDYEEAQDFSIEQVIKLGSLGIHKFWMYHSLEKVQEVFMSYLE
jgi:hypothetical protein